jgi:zinc/manganese transport system permease protein
VAITALHSYVGLHVIKRGVIFVDLALAQCAALGAAVALFITPYVCEIPEHDHTHRDEVAATRARLADEFQRESDEASAATTVHDEDGHAEHPADHIEEPEHGWLTYSMSLGFALLGAVVLSVGRLHDERIPHEAIIGIIFVVCAALSVLILSKAPHGHEKMEAMLVGSILFVRWTDLAAMLPLYALLGVFHIVFRRPFMEISRDLPGAERSGRRVRLWDCLFYGSFAVLVTHSVAIAGVFVVFSYLIIPPACASLLRSGFGLQTVVAWSVGIGTTIVGLALSALGDTPTGPTLVSCFGAVLAAALILRAFAQGGRRGAIRQ